MTDVLVVVVWLLVGGLFLCMIRDFRRDEPLPPPRSHVRTRPRPYNQDREDTP